MTRLTIAAPFLAALLIATPACSKKDDASSSSPQALSKAQETEKAAQAEKAEAKTRLMIIRESWRSREDTSAASDKPGSSKDAKSTAKSGSATPAAESKASTAAPSRRVARAPLFEKGERIAGDTDDVKLSYATARQMDIEGTDEIAILARLCLDDRGTPVSATIIEGSGYEQADQSVRAEIMTWEYEPYTVDGKPVPFCELLTFRISLQDSLG